MSSEPPLIIACRDGDCDALRAALGALVDQPTDPLIIRMALCIACQNGHVDCVRLLIEGAAHHQDLRLRQKKGRVGTAPTCM